jgi:hypothetical protein
MAHESVYEFRQRPRFAESDERVPMIGHHNKCAEVDPVALHGKGKRLDDALAQLRIQHRLFRSEGFGHEQSRRSIRQPVKTQILGMGV